MHASVVPSGTPAAAAAYVRSAAARYNRQRQVLMPNILTQAAALLLELAVSDCCLLDALQQRPHPVQQ